MVVKDTEKLRASALRSPLQFQSVPLMFTERGRFTKGERAERGSRGNKGMTETEEISSRKIIEQRSGESWRSQLSLPRLM